jgi:CRP-like cAMP-binding protein
MQSEGDSIQHARAYATDWLGLANVTSHLVPYLHSAIVIDYSEILSLDIPRFAALRCNQEFSQYLLQVIGKEQLAEEVHRLNGLSCARSYDRLILFLAAETERMRRRGILSFQPPYIVGTQQYFADAIGVSRETVSRDLQLLLKEGILERSIGVRPARYNILKQLALSELAASPLRRSDLYARLQNSRMHRRFSDVA